MPSWVPAGHNCVCPYVHASDVGALIEFLKTTFGAVELFRMPGPDGDVDAAHKRALGAGGKSVRERNQWFMATHRRDVPVAEMKH